MNPRILMCLLLALAAGCRSPASRARPVDPAETKVRLYAEALAARDAGDLGTAKSRLQSLLEIAPNDAGTRRLLAAVEAALAAPPPPAPAAVAPVIPPVVAVAPLPTVAPVPARPAPAESTPRPSQAAVVPAPVVPASRAPSPGPGAMPVVIEEPAPGATPAAPPDPRVEARVRVETTGAALANLPEEARTERLMAYVQAQRALAAEYAKEGNFITAVATLDAALASINISTDELRVERARYVQDDVRSREGIRLRRRR